jgi:hypothetical protein
LLDFYHGGEHLWDLGRACWREEGAAEAWVEPRLHQLRHGQEEAALKEIAGLKAPRGEAGEVVRKEKNYFAGQKNRMNYKEIADRGWPIGSAAVESACRQSQCQFKRPGQFWTQPGFRNLNALDGARRNGHWDDLWITDQPTFASIEELTTDCTDSTDQAIVDSGPSVKSVKSVVETSKEVSL